MGIVAGNYRRIALRRLPLAASIHVTAIFNSLTAAVTSAILGRRFARTQFAGDPVFILGYWRSGTTLLHELLLKDEAFASPTNFQCMAPEFFPLAAPLARLIDTLTPRKRPMDAMTISMSHPQEDDFAMLSMGEKTMYRYLAFRSVGVGDHNWESYWPANEADWQRWLDRWIMFLKRVQHANPGRRLLLKSPLHTGRIARILQRFPNARFLHISRNPFDLFASNIKLNRAMQATQTLESHISSDQAIAEGVLSTHDRLYRAFFEERNLLPVSRLHCIRYEDLVAQPEETLAEAYRALGLSGFADLAPRIREEMAGRSGYRPDSYSIDDETRSMIAHRWQRYFTEFGYRP